MRPAWWYLLKKRTSPLSRSFGYDRGTPIDRYYIERFLDKYRDAIQGRCLEVADDGYTRRFGSGVRQSDVLDIDPENKKANVAGDLRRLDVVADHAYDCVILTQVLQFIDDVPAAVREAYRILKPGGALLATVPSLSPIDTDVRSAKDLWRFTPAAIEAIVAPVFGKEHIHVQAFGNCVAGMAFWIGMSAEELAKEQLEAADGRYPCLVAVRAVKQTQNSNHTVT